MDAIKPMPTLLISSLAPLAMCALTPQNSLEYALPVLSVSLLMTALEARPVLLFLLVATKHKQVKIVSKCALRDISAKSPPSLLNSALKECILQILAFALIILNAMSKIQSS